MVTNNNTIKTSNHIFNNTGFNLELHKKDRLLLFKDNNKTLDKLYLKDTNGLTPNNKEDFKTFKESISNKTNIKIEFLDDLFKQYDLTLTDYYYNNSENPIKINNTSDTLDDPQYIKFNEYYQNSSGIYKTENNKIIARCFILDAVKRIDPLRDEEGKELFKPVYDLIIYNIPNQRRENYNKLTNEQLIQALKDAKVFLNPQDIEDVINNFYIEALDKVKVIEAPFKKGFFIVNGKVYENTNIKGLEYTKDQLKDAIILLNNILEDRTPEGRHNDAALYKFMLSAPFSFCLKQIGYTNGLRGLIGQGKPQANKTGAALTGYKFYLYEGEPSGAATLSAFGSKLEQSTFSPILDEADGLFNYKQFPDVLKRAIFNITSREVKDKTDNTKLLNFTALSEPILLFNPFMSYPGELTRRLIITMYTNKSIITDKEAEKFNKKYTPLAKDTILNNLKYIGAAFKERFIKILEDPQEYNKLFDLEALTIEILKDIGAFAGVEFNNIMYTKTQEINEFKRDTSEDIKLLLNSEFKKENKYNLSQLYKSDNLDIDDILKECAKLNNFDFLYYNTAADDDYIFIINSAKFKKYINDHLKESFNIIEIIEALDLKDDLTEYQKQDDTFKNYPLELYLKNKQNSITYSNRKKGNVKGFKVTADQLKFNIFGLDFI